MAEADFTFDHPPTAEEVEKFEYTTYGYIVDNPGYVDGVFVSYAGLYYNEKGEKSGIYTPNPNVTQY